MGVLSSSSSSSLAWKMSIEYAYMYICCPQRKCIVFAFFFKKKKVECADPRTCILLLPESGAAGGGRQAGRQTALGVRYTSTIFLPGKKAAETQSIDRYAHTWLFLSFFSFNFPSEEEEEQQLSIRNESRASWCIPRVAAAGVSLLLRHPSSEHR